MRRTLLVLAALLTAGVAAVAVHIASGDPGVCTCRDEDGAGRVPDPHCTIHTTKENRS